MVDVVSLDGKITKGDSGEVHTWSSKEDWQEFLRLRDSQQVLIMGSTTYQSVKPRPGDSLLRIVLTSQPEKYADAARPGQLEFITATPRQLMARLAKENYERVMVLGGSHVNSEFLQAGLVDEAYITLEPVVLGTGTPLVAARPLMVRFTLQSVQRLNDRGTLLLHYLLDRSS